MNIFNWYPRRSCCRDCGCNALPRRKKLRKKIGNCSWSFSCFRLLIFALYTFYYSFTKSRMRKQSCILCPFQSRSCLVPISLTSHPTLCTERCSAADRNQPCAVLPGQLCAALPCSLFLKIALWWSQNPKACYFKMSFTISMFWIFIFWMLSPIDLIAKKMTICPLFLSCWIN